MLLCVFLGCILPSSFHTDCTVGAQHSVYSPYVALWAIHCMYVYGYVLCLCCICFAQSQHDEFVQDDNFLVLKSFMNISSIPLHIQTSLLHLVALLISANVSKVQEKYIARCDELQKKVDQVRDKHYKLKKVFGLSGIRMMIYAEDSLKSKYEVRSFDVMYNYVLFIF